MVNGNDYNGRKGNGGFAAYGQKVEALKRNANWVGMEKYPGVGCKYGSVPYVK